MTSPYFLKIALSLRIPLALYGLCLLLIFIHEMGHLLVGLACGFRLVYVRVSCLKLILSQGWTWDWRWKAAFSGATAVAARQESTSCIQLRFFFFLLAGPLANLACGLLALPFYRDKTLTGGIVAIFVLFSALMAAINLISASGGETDTDGKKLFGLLFSKRRREELIFGLTLALRFDQVRDLCGAGQIQHAYDRIEEIARSIETFPNLAKNAACTRLLENFQRPILRSLASAHNGPPDDPAASPICDFDIVQPVS